MKSRIWILSLVVLIGIVIVIWFFFVDTTPSGPIIVIEPEPETQAGAAPATLAPYTTHWFAGCPNLSGKPTEATADPALTEIPSEYFRWTGASTVKIELKNPSETITARELELSLDGGRALAIKHAKADKVPEWKIADRGLWGKVGVKPPNWPKELFGEITGTINVTDQKGKFDKIPRERLVAITIQFNHFGPYNKCP